MPRKQAKQTAQLQPLSTRILDAAPNIRVREVVTQERLNNLPPKVRSIFGDMKIKWAPNRAWGLSFTLGRENYVTIGHRRGDHLCTHPELFGLSEDEAESLLRFQIEGTLLHELGHAIFDLYLKDHAGFKEAAAAALADGAPSTYRGQDVDGMTPEDLLHEMFAEAFRYWCHANPDLRAAQPSWDALAARVIANADQAATSNTSRRPNGRDSKRDHVVAADRVRQAARVARSAALEYDWLTDGWPGRMVRQPSQAQIDAAFSARADAQLSFVRAVEVARKAGLSYDDLDVLLREGEQTADSLFALVHGA